MGKQKQLMMQQLEQQKIIEAQKQAEQQLREEEVKKQNQLLIQQAEQQRMFEMQQHEKRQQREEEKKQKELMMQQLEQLNFFDHSLNEFEAQRNLMLTPPVTRDGDIKRSKSKELQIPSSIDKSVTRGFEKPPLTSDTINNTCLHFIHHIQIPNLKQNQIK